MIALASALCFSAWVLLLGFRGRFWRSLPVLDEVAILPSAPPVVVVVPARNEADNIERSIGSLLAQDYPGELTIILVDDSSTDRTVEIAASLDTGGRLIIRFAPPPPPGWTGKLWAVNHGLSEPLARAAEYVLLTDADIQHNSAHILLLVAKAQNDNLDLASEMVHLNCVTGPERALIPAFVFFFQMLYPFDWVSNPRKRTAGAAGGTMLVRRSALERTGGVLPIRNELIDDCALARQIKGAGGSIWLGHSESSVSTRVYSDWDDVWNMIARTAYTQLDYSPLKLAGCTLAMGVVYCAPPLLAIFGRGLPRLLGAASWLAMCAAFRPTLRRYRRSPLWEFALPGIAMFYLGATIASAVRHHSGRGGGWKDRVYPQLPSN